jgi:hypothetical protein
MPIELSEMQQRFGDRFDGMELCAVEQVYWPVFRHRLCFSIRQFVELDALEEGFLRIALAGLTDISEISGFVGCSIRYGKKMAAGLSNRAGGLLEPPLRFQDPAVFPTNTTQQVLTACEKAVIVTKEISLIRDAVFGQWIDHGEHRFRCLPLAQRIESPAKWLGAQVSSSATTDVQDTVQYAIDLQPRDEEIVSSDFGSSGDLHWIRLYLGCYQQESRQSGRFLLFNPESDDQPLPGLSADFERLLRAGGSIASYFPDDSLGTTKAFWTAMACRLKAVAAHEEISNQNARLHDLHKALIDAQTARANRPKALPELQREFLEAATASSENLAAGDMNSAVTGYYSALKALVDSCFCKAQFVDHQSDLNSKVRMLRSERKFADDQVELLLAHIRNAGSWIEVLSRGDASEWHSIAGQIPAGIAGLRLLARELGVTEPRLTPKQGMSTEDQAIERAAAEINRQQTEIEKLEKLVAEMPVTRHLSVAEHPDILHKALRDAREVLVVISPWIKMRVLSRYLRDIDSALERGCEIWIGYGMPRSEFHRDNSDERALAALRERAQNHRLFLVELGTHEKVLIQDDDVFVNTSFNWLSYDGNDGRRESGLLQCGGVQAIRQKFLADLKARQHSRVDSARRDIAVTSKGAHV